MRVALGIAVSALCLASPPAFAGEGAAHRGDAPLRLADSADVAGPVVVSTINKLIADFRLRTAVVTAKPSLLDDPEGRVQRRIASSMFDFYPGGNGVGFHLSAGMRYYSRTNFAIEAQKMTNGLLYSPNWHTGNGSRAGFKRFTPAMTFGYTGAVTRNLHFGLEGGALLGRVNSSAPQSLRRPWIGSALEERSGLNPVANFVLGLRF